MIVCYAIVLNLNIHMCRHNFPPLGSLSSLLSMARTKIMEPSCDLIT